MSVVPSIVGVRHFWNRDFGHSHLVNALRLSNRAEDVIVTGASRGIGAAIARLSLGVSLPWTSRLLSFFLVATHSDSSSPHAARRWIKSMSGTNYPDRLTSEV
jgi:hypothetical protein